MDLLLPDGKPRRVVLSDDYDPTTGVHTNPRTVYLLPGEDVPTSLDEVEALLAKDAETHDIVAEKAMGAALDLDAEADPLDHLKATLDALDADDSKEAMDWKAVRTVTKESIK